MAHRGPSAVRFLWEHHRPAVLAMVLALILATIFAARLVFFAVYWSDPTHRDQPIEAWMTPGFVAHSRHVDIEAVRAVLQVTPDEFPDGPPTLTQIARVRGIPVEDLIAAIETALPVDRPQPGGAGE